MGLWELLASVPAPATPVWAGDKAEWEEVQEELGTVLPRDYRELIQAYGCGGFCCTFAILSPFGGRRGLISTHKAREAFFRTMLSTYGDPTFRVYPEEGGILYVGGDEYTNSLTWLTTGTPDRWPLVLFDDHMREYEMFEMPLTTFLIKWVKGDIEPLVHHGLFDKPPLERTPLFKPVPVAPERT